MGVIVFGNVHDNKIFYTIINRISINMMNNLRFVQFSSNMLFHYMSMFICPVVFLGTEFNFNINNSITFVKSFSKNWNRTWIIKSTHSLRNLFSSFCFIFGYFKTITALSWVIKRFSIVAFSTKDRFTTYTARFGDKFFHGYSINAHQCDCQVIYGGI